MGIAAAWRKQQKWVDFGRKRFGRVSHFQWKLSKMLLKKMQCFAKAFINAFDKYATTLLQRI